MKRIVQHTPSLRAMRLTAHPLTDLLGFRQDLRELRPLLCGPATLLAQDGEWVYRVCIGCGGEVIEWALMRPSLEDE